MKKQTAALLLALGIFCGCLPAAQASGSVAAVMNGCRNGMPVDGQSTIVYPVSGNSSTPISVSRSDAAFGSGDSRQANAASFSRNVRTMHHVTSANIAFTPQEKKASDTASRIVNNLTHMPLRHALEGLGLMMGYALEDQFEMVNIPAPEANSLSSQLEGIISDALSQSGGTAHAPDTNSLSSLLESMTRPETTSRSDGTAYAPDADSPSSPLESMTRPETTSRSDGTAQTGMVLVSTPAAVESKAVTKDSVSVQDPFNYMPASMTFEPIETNRSGHQYREFRGGADGDDLMNGYVDALCATGNFILKDSYHQTYTSTFFSFALTYTGTGRVSDQKPAMNFKDNVTGDVTIYGIIDRGRSEGYVHIAKGLEFDDLGLRSTGETASTAAPGQSLYTDLYRMPDGSYQTGDGRFHVAVGEAQVYRDGVAYAAPARLLRNRDKSREELLIENFYRSDSILFTAPYNSLLTGDIFDIRSIGLNQTGGRYDEYMRSMDSFLGWKFSNQIVGVCHDGDYLACYQDGGNGFEQVSARVMYWDTDLGEAVIYLCATFDTAPYEYEALAAVKMETNRDVAYTGDSSSGSSGSSSFDSSSSWSYQTRKRCTALGCDGGKVECSACDGDGGRWVYDNSTPRYDGVSSTTARTWENCYKCYGTGKTSCSRCGGDGWID